MASNKHFLIKVYGVSVVKRVGAKSGNMPSYISYQALYVIGGWETNSRFNVLFMFIEVCDICAMKMLS